MKPIIARCDCGGPHYMTVEHWVDKQVIVQVVEAGFQYSFWQGLSALWGIICGRTHSWVEVVLDQNDALDLAFALLQHATQEEVT